MGPWEPRILKCIPDVGPWEPWILKCTYIGRGTLETQDPEVYIYLTWNLGNPGSSNVYLTWDLGNPGS